MTDRGVVDLRRVAGAVAGVPRAVCVDVVEDVKAIARRAAPPFTRARPGSAYPLRSFDEIVDHGSLVFARIQGVPVGFWSIASYGAKRHRIPGAKSLRRSRARRLAGGKRRLLSFGPGAGAAWGPVKHPGATGRRYWDRVVDTATPVVLERFDATIDEALDA